MSDAYATPSLALVGSHREFPVPRHLARATLLLLELEYTGPAIDSILTHLNRYGSAVGCVWIDPNHRDMVEDTLPMSAEYSDPAWEADVWNAIDDRDFDEDGFEVPSEPSRELAVV